MSKLRMISSFGQSIWLDYIDRQLLHSGKLITIIEQDGIGGVTSNPAIFLKAISSDSGYADEIQAAAKRGETVATIYEQLVIHDIREAADQLQPVYQRTDRRDGYVSLEVSPKLAHDDEATIREAHRLWSAVGRENLMIKVPATEAGIAAIARLIADGINVNATLLFSRQMYAKVAEAYISGLEQLYDRRASLHGIASVASFFVSRIDNEVDNSGAPEHLLGKVAIANAKLAYQHYLEAFSGPRWENLAAHGAETQRLLWASTGTKNPAYSDVLYIEELIGQDTVNTAPPATIDAFRDHGWVTDSLPWGAETARTVLDDLAASGISLNEITDRLLDNGIWAFNEAYDALLSTIAGKHHEHTREEVSQ